MASSEQQETPGGQRGADTDALSSLIAGRLSSPALLLLITILSIILAEGAIMLILEWLPQVSLFATAILDAGLLTVIITPCLYFLVIRPLRFPGARMQFQTKEAVDSEYKYRSMVDTSEDSIYLLDREYRYLFINRRHLERLNRTAEQCLGKRYGEFHLPEETTRLERAVDQVFSLNKTCQHDYKSLGSAGYFLRTLSPVIDHSNTVIAVAVISRNFSRRKKLDEDLATFAITDDLTGLFNRRGFFLMAEEKLQQADQQKQRLLVLLADIDNLDLINEAFGIEEGDRIIQASAEIISEHFADCDLVARIGGDGFVVFKSGAGVDELATISEALQQKIDALNNRRALDLQLSISLGVAQYDPNEPCSVDYLLVQADKSMKEEQTKRNFRP